MDGRIVIDFEGCKARLAELKKATTEIQAMVAKLRQSADLAGIYEGKGATSYQNRLQDEERKQQQWKDSIDALTDTLQRFTDAVETGQMEVAASILSGG